MSDLPEVAIINDNEHRNKIADNVGDKQNGENDEYDANDIEDVGDTDVCNEKLFSLPDEIENPHVYVINNEVIDIINTGTLREDVNTGYNDDHYKLELADSIRYLLKHLKHRSTTSKFKLQEFSKYCILIFGSKFDDDNLWVILLKT